MPNVSSRGQKVPFSPFRKLVPYAEEAKKKGKHVYHLNIGQPDILTPDYAIQQLQEAKIDIVAYSPAVGIQSYREKLTDYYEQSGIPVNPDDIIVTTGASEGIQLLFFACMNPGDEVIITEPFYANYNGFAQIADVKINPVTCKIEDGFAFPGYETIERKISSRTRGIFLTNPSNPTGVFYPESVMREIGMLVKKYDLFLFVDEVYREFVFDGHSFFSAMNIENLEDHVVIVDSVSKRFSACGARVGTVITKNEPLKRSLTKYAKLRLSPPALAQMLSEAMLDNCDTYLQSVKEEYDQRRTLVYNRLSKMPGVISYKPTGAFYCFARFPVDNAEHFCQWLLEDFDHNGATLMLSPGEGFYATPGMGIDEVRIAFVLNTADLEAAMDCLEAALEIYPYRKVAASKALV